MSFPSSMASDIFCGDRSGCVFAAGWWQAPDSYHMWRYDTSAQRWAAIADLPFSHEASYGHGGGCTVTDDGWIYASDGNGRLARLRLM
jgi:hypothetical protein